MRIGTGLYFKSRELKDKLKKDKTAYDIFDYLCDYAEWQPQTEKRRGIEIEISKGQLLTSEIEIEEYFLSTWGEKIGRTVIRNRLSKLEELGFIDIEEIKKGKQPLGKKITVEYLRVLYETQAQQEVDDNDVQQEENDGVPYSTHTQQGIEGNDIQQNSENVQQNVQQNVPYSTHTQQGIEGNDIQRNVQRNVQPLLKKDLNNLLKKDLKKEEVAGARVTDLNSIVNTFGQIYQYFEKRVVARPTPYHAEMLEAFLEEGLEAALLMAIMDKAGKNGTKSAPAYFEEVCSDLRKKGIVTLDNYIQDAAQYKQQFQKTGTDQRRVTRGSYEINTDDAPF